MAGGILSIVAFAFLGLGLPDGEPVAPPLTAARRVRSLRRALQAILWTSAHPALVVVGLFGLAWLLARLFLSDRDRVSRRLGLKELR